MRKFLIFALVIMSFFVSSAYARGMSVDSVKNEVDKTFKVLTTQLKADLNTRQGRRKVEAQHMKVFNVNRQILSVMVGIYYTQESGFDVDGMYATESRGFAVGPFANSDGKNYVYRVIIEKTSVGVKGQGASEVFQVYAHETTDDGFSADYISLTGSNGQWDEEIQKYHWTVFSKIVFALQDVQDQIHQMQ